MTTKIKHKLFAFVITANALLGIANVQAQTNVPDAMNFQAIARDASNNIVANTSIEVQMTVHNNSSSGAILSQLRFIRNTDAFGQFSLTMSVDSASGIGTAQTVAFNQIDWSTGDKYIQIEYKPSISSPYIDLGAIRANSTFYAFHSRTAENITLPATNGQVLKYNGTSNKWEAGADNNTAQNLSISGNTLSLSGSTPAIVTLPSYTAGSGIAINGSNVVSVKSVNDYAVYEERYVSGTYIAGVTGWNQRNLNYTQDSSGSSISRTNSVITLQPGKYYIKANATSFDCYESKLCTRTVANSIVLIGTSEYSHASSDASINSFVEGFITINAQTSYVLSHYINSASNSSTMGRRSIIPNIPEVFARIIIQKIN